MGKKRVQHELSSTSLKQKAEDFFKLGVLRERPPSYPKSLVGTESLGRGVNPESTIHWVSPRPVPAHENTLPPFVLYGCTEF